LKVVIRVGLFVTYSLLAFGILLYFAGAGHGSYKPPAVMFGWGVVPWQLELVPGWVGLIAVPLVYLALLFLGSARLVRLYGLGAYAVVPVVHAGGVIVALSLLGRESLPPSFPASAALVLPLAVAVAFFLSDFFGLREIVSGERGDRLLNVPGTQVTK
jgi:hypothetical protein